MPLEENIPISVVFFHFTELVLEIMEMRMITTPWAD